MITNFLKTTRSKEELRCALDVLREFKGQESLVENVMAPSWVWIRLDQLEEFLEHLVDGKPLQPDTLRAMK